MNYIKLGFFARVLVIITATTFLVAITMAGYKPATRKADASWSWSRGWDIITKAFGGVSSFWGVVVLIIIAMFVIWVVKYIADDKDIDNIWAGIAALVLVVVGGYLIDRLVDLPDTAGYVLVGVGALCLAASAAITWPIGLPVSSRPKIKN